MNEDQLVALKFKLQQAKDAMKAGNVSTADMELNLAIMYMEHCLEGGD